MAEDIFVPTDIGAKKYSGGKHAVGDAPICLGGGVVRGLFWRNMDTASKSRLITGRGRMAAAQSCAVVVETDGEYRIRWVTPSVEPILGWRPAAMVGRVMTELIHPDERKSLTSELSERNLLLRALRENGTHQWMKGFSSPLSDEAGATLGWIFSLQDVDELVSRRRLLSTVLANVDAHIYMKGEDRCYRYANAPVQELMGRPLEQIIGRTDDELLPRETAAVVTAFDDEVFRTGSPICREEIIPDQQGRPRIFLSKKLLMQQPDQPDCLIGFSTEITELKQAEASLRVSERQLAEAEQRYRAMLENGQGVVVETDQRGLVTVMSPAIATLIGMKPAQCIGEPLEKFVEETDQPALRSLLASCLQGASGQAFLQVATPQGEHRKISVVMHPAHGKNGAIAGTSGWWREAEAA
jgi:PAS domain S-box-containing protein